MYGGPKYNIPTSQRCHQRRVEAHACCQGAVIVGAVASGLLSLVALLGLASKTAAISGGRCIFSPVTRNALAPMNGCRSLVWMVTELQFDSSTIVYATCFQPVKRSRLLPGITEGTPKTRGQAIAHVPLNGASSYNVQSSSSNRGFVSKHIGLWRFVPEQSTPKFAFSFDDRPPIPESVPELWLLHVSTLQGQRFLRQRVRLGGLLSNGVEEHGAKRTNSCQPYLFLSTFEITGLSGGPQSLKQVKLQEHCVNSIESTVETCSRRVIKPKYFCQVGPAVIDLLRSEVSFGSAVMDAAVLGHRVRYLGKYKGRFNEVPIALYVTRSKTSLMRGIRSFTPEPAPTHFLALH
ncbi:hypothetical protein BDN67DRAFT_983067 [Paxillus ammoniavirescens]|nr:hypothetical protein BDN67DRAFT_983067 [Paxillus ammoniavirescens]